jgi:hypothetical protein
MQKLAREGQGDMAPDTVCWNSAIKAWAQVGNGEQAEVLVGIGNRKESKQLH